MIIRSCRISSVSLKPFITRSIFTSNKLRDESSSDDEKPKPQSDSRRKEAARKLEELVLQMAREVSKEQNEPSKFVSEVRIPKPREVSRKKGFDDKKQRQLEAERWEKEKLGNQLAEAATKVAESLGGDTKKTESELLKIYFSRHLKPSESEDGDESPAEADVPLSDVLSGMKVEKSEEVPREVSRAHQVRAMTDDTRTKPRQFMKKPKRSSGKIKVNIFSEQPFKYFDVDKIKSQNVTPVSLPTWDYLYERDLKLLVTHPPKNIFEQLIQWTEDGKVWRFPIDNEQDWLEEQKYDFTDHVFLEHWLEPWCPETGPIRSFMELVCVGLSRNPYLTVPEKQAHIFWYEHYFRSKNSLLIETGVGSIKDRAVAESQSA